MHILVTGGAGYIGSHMTRMLAARGYIPVVLDSMEFGHKEALPREAILITGNVGDRDVLARIFGTYTIAGVLHFAGYIRVEESIRHPIRYMHNNLIAPVALLDAMKGAGVTSIIFSSTAAVYGNPKTSLISEDHPKHPISPYGLSKWAFEELLWVYDRSSGIKSIALRYFNAAGASFDGSYGEMHADESHLIPLACEAALGRRKDFAIYGSDYETKDGTAIRDYIHVEDLCEAHILALEALRNGHESQVYNVGTGVGISVAEVVSAIRNAIGSDFPVTARGRRIGDPAVLVANPSKLMKEFGWKPKYSDIRTIIQSALEWHKSHPDGYSTGQRTVRMGQEA